MACGFFWLGGGGAVGREGTSEKIISINCLSCHPHKNHCNTKRYHRNLI